MASSPASPTLVTVLLLFLALSTLPRAAANCPSRCTEQWRRCPPTCRPSRVCNVRTRRLQRVCRGPRRCTVLPRDIFVRGWRCVQRPRPRPVPPPVLAAPAAGSCPSQCATRAVCSAPGCTRVACLRVNGQARWRCTNAESPDRFGSGGGFSSPRRPACTQARPRCPGGYEVGRCALGGNGIGGFTCTLGKQFFPPDEVTGSPRPTPFGVLFSPRPAVSLTPVGAPFAAPVAASLRPLPSAAPVAASLRPLPSAAPLPQATGGQPARPLPMEPFAPLPSDEPAFMPDPLASEEPADALSETPAPDANTGASQGGEGSAGVCGGKCELLVTCDLSRCDIERCATVDGVGQLRCVPKPSAAPGTVAAPLQPLRPAPVPPGLCMVEQPTCQRGEVERCAIDANGTLGYRCAAVVPA